MNIINFMLTKVFKKLFFLERKYIFLFHVGRAIILAITRSLGLLKLFSYFMNIESTCFVLIFTSVLCKTSFLSLVVCVVSVWELKLMVLYTFLWDGQLSAISASVLTKLTHFQPMLHFYTPWKHQKISDSLIFSGGIEMEHCLKTV